MKKVRLFRFPILLTLTIFTLIYLSSCRKTEPSRRIWTSVRTFARDFGEPFGAAFDKNGNLFVADGERGEIYRVLPDGAKQLFAAGLDTPSQIAFAPDGNLIVADSGSHTIKKIKPDGSIEIIAGIENQAGFADGAARKALFHAPIGVAVDGEKIYVADTYNDKIRVIENNFVTTLAGDANGFADGAGNSARFNTPCGIAVWRDGRILIADAGNSRIRVVEPNGAVWTLSGDGKPEIIDGELGAAEFVQPVSVAVDKTGAVFVADGNAIRVIGRRLFPLVETISNSRRGLSDGQINMARFNRPSGLAFDKSGNLFVADSENQLIRVFTGAEIGKEITDAEKSDRQISAAEFRHLQPPRWTYDPPDAPRDVAATLGEIRGELSADKTKQARFHNGLDIAGNYGETARFVRREKVLRPAAAENFDTLRELLRLPTLGYIHIRLGRDRNNQAFDDARFLFQIDASDKKINVRVPRGSKFEAGEAIGTLNAFNHVHLIAGRSGAEMNALAALDFPNLKDDIAPIIEDVTLYDEHWQEIKSTAPIKLNGKIRVVVRAFDRMNGNAARRKLGVYRLGYQILDRNENPLGETNWTIRFDRMPDERAVPFVYAVGSQSGYTPQTIFDYIVTNEAEGENFRENFLDTADLDAGNYILRIFAADYFGNTITKDVKFESVK